MTYEFSTEIRAFLQEKKYLQNVSPETIVLYQTSFKAFYGCENLQDIKLRVVALREKGIKPVSVNTYLRHMKTFYLSLGREWKMPWLQEEEKILVTLTAEHVSRLLKFVVSAKMVNLQRAHLVALTILDTGLRASEVLGLHKVNCDWDNMTFKVLGKGGKHRLVPVSLELRKVLWRYASRSTDKFNLLFGTKNDTRVSVRNLERDLKKLGKQIGFPGLRPHLLRHTMAINWIKKGGDLYMLSRVLGHASISTTTIYLRSLGVSDISATAQRVSLLSR